jgi:NADH-quinone oxidoreductase subunit A
MNGFRFKLYYLCTEISKMLLYAQSQTLDYLPIVLMFLVAAGFVGGVMGITHWMGPKHKSKVKLETFECGIDVKGNARTPFSIKYFLVAILFVLFDVEVIFMYPWAVNFKKLGLLGIVEMFTFIAVFLVGFVYIIRKGALKWE